jgi:hypothetical protein
MGKQPSGGISRGLQSMHPLNKLSEYIGICSGTPVARFFGVTMLAWLPAQCLAVIASAVSKSSDADLIFRSSYHMILGGLLLAPLLETVGMKYLFRLGAKRIAKPVLLNFYCALFWGLAHHNAPGFGIHAVWAFFVLGACFQELAKRSENFAVINVTIIHVLFNTLSYILYLLNGSS